jgi:hypothetical protein
MASRRYNIVHVVPDDRIHGLYGYREVIETLEWGLRTLGHEVTVSSNAFASGSTNIVFGFQTMAAQAVAALPADTIIYNFEQMAGRKLDQLKPSYHAAARRLRVWEYSERNMDTWQQLKPSLKVIHVPVGWAPVLERIPRNVDQDIEVLFYGFPGLARLTIFNELCRQGVRSLFVCGLYGKSRDDLIARSKLVLNINLYDRSRIFEVVRVSYLLANSKAVVADGSEDAFVESDLRDAVAFEPPERVTARCLALLEDDKARVRLGEHGQEIIRKRDIRTILSRVLDITDSTPESEVQSYR